jgi:DNA-binding transcriptional MerR regulator
MTTRLLQIGEVAEQTGLSLRTVRYYEQMGLITPERRSDGGFRLYSSVQVTRLRLIKRMKPLGFHIDQMRELLEARDTLHAVDSAPAARDAAAHLLAEYAQSANQRVRDLREQLTHAQDFSDQLAREVATLT